MPEAALAASAARVHPKLATVLKEGYGWAALRSDAVAGLTVAIVALPLSMAIAIASGVGPERGLYTAIVGGFLISLLGGSRFQIGGPAAAFVVLVAATVSRQGVDGLLLAVMISGLLLALLGALRLGGLVRLIPHSVTVGFTAGIAATIFIGQIKDFLGLTLARPEPGPVIPKLAAFAHALPTVSWPAAALAVGVAATILLVRRWRPLLPGMLIAVAGAALAAVLLHLPIATIGSRFGGIPSGLPLPRLPVITPAAVLAVMPAALSFTLLGGIESLLSAVVADSMTGRRHRSNMELIAQGIANVASALFGGICATGTIARTATNVRAGARSPVAGMLHALFLLLFMLVAAPLASYIPVAALAGVLTVVAWGMIERGAIARLARQWEGGLALLATFALTLLHDLIVGIVAGCLVAAAFWAVRRFRPASAAG